MQNENGAAFTDKPDFALIGHPFDLDHLYRYLKYHKSDLKRPKDELLLKLFEWTPPFADRWIEVTSKTGRTIRGKMIMCPLLPEMVKDSNNLRFRTLCIEKVIASLELASGLGAKISALGGFTSIADGDQGRLVAEKVPGLAVSSGNTLTAMAAADGVIRSSKLLGLNLSGATATVVGASGDIGLGCCRFLVPKVKRLILVSRFAFNLQRIAKELRLSGPAEVIVEPDSKKAVALSDVVITAASSVTPIFHQHDFKPGAIVCDVGYPKNIFADYAIARSEIFLFSGGLLESPTPVLMTYDIGLPDPSVLYGCWSETIVLALERRYESFSLGRGHIVPERMQLIWDLAMKHGFRPAPFFYGEDIWSEDNIGRIRALLHNKSR
jgi:predicted amino acid dehydrogenase